MLEGSNSDQATSPQGNGVQKSNDQVIAELRAECERLRQALAQAEEERELYLRAVYAGARRELIAELSEFRDMGIEDFKRMGVGPVELID